MSPPSWFPFQCFLSPPIRAARTNNAPDGSHAFHSSDVAGQRGMNAEAFAVQYQKPCIATPNDFDSSTFRPGECASPVVLEPLTLTWWSRLPWLLFQECLRLWPQPYGTLHSCQDAIPRLCVWFISAPRLWHRLRHPQRRSLGGFAT
ncbi:hypothetical protein BD310DRAFT_657109 [Dichomitus squalens]|uniref:Uncharacterized protein n=1 Tax=Dichomitus squalens TaxID=114155 RepID=A0A4V2K983_9APHY|nr:hypothetical protein BD310DRAFT_657109 [Dichomitus squalens]